MLCDAAYKPWEAYWNEFKKTIPEEEYAIHRFWTNHGWLTGFIHPDLKDEDDHDYQLVKDYSYSLKIYTDARKEGRKSCKELIRFGGNAG